MDFPELLETCELVDGSDQIKQSIVLLLQNTVGSFCQDPKLGALFDIHTFDYAVMHAAIYDTLGVLPIDILSVDVFPPEDSDLTATCKVSVVYSFNNERFRYDNF